MWIFEVCINMMVNMAVMTAYITVIHFHILRVLLFCLCTKTNTFPKFHSNCFFFFSKYKMSLLVKQAILSQKYLLKIRNLKKYYTCTALANYKRYLWPLANKRFVCYIQYTV